MEDEDYMLFIPPDQLLNKPVSKWTLKESTEYLKWLVENTDSRLSNLLNYIGKAYPSSCKDLVGIGETVAPVLKSRAFSTGSQLTEKGVALASDLGLLVGKMLLDHDSHVVWGIGAEKLGENYNYTPVLEGFAIGRFDPIGASVFAAASILEDDKGDRAWFDMFVYWSNHISEA